jgi:hypothetical protein
MDWTPELKERVVKEYLEANPTAETSSEIVKTISEGLDGSTVNGVRLILAKSVDAEGNKVYISKASAAAKSTDKPKTKRVNKAESIKELTDLIEAAGLEVDDDIVSKMTGKAAVYFTEIFNKLNKD